MAHVKSRTFIAKTAELLADKEMASVIVRLMMALNDIAMASEGLGEWIATDDYRKVQRQNGGKLYYGRMLMAHVYEGLTIIEDIQKSARLNEAVQKCDPQTRASFGAVAAFLGSADHEMLCKIRNNAAFHYARKLALRALEQLDAKYPGHTFTYSLGVDPLVDWYFELGDLVSDRMVVRNIFKADEDADLRRAIDPILVRLHTMAGAFSDFAGNFIRHQLKR
jgi:hypothetical protein